MSVFRRLVSSFISDVAIKALANSRVFQRVALKTHVHVKDAKTSAHSGADSVTFMVTKTVSKVRELATAVHEEIDEDVKKVLKLRGDGRRTRSRGRKRC